MLIVITRATTKNIVKKKSREIKWYTRKYHKEGSNWLIEEKGVRHTDKHIKITDINPTLSLVY